jgi:hypothetical protein
MMAHTCNPTNSRGSDWDDQGSKDPNSTNKKAGHGGTCHLSFLGSINRSITFHPGWPGYKHETLSEK